MAKDPGRYLVIEVSLRLYMNFISINQSVYNTSGNETARTSRRDEQDSQAPGALMTAFIKHTKFKKTLVLHKTRRYFVEHCNEHTKNRHYYSFACCICLGYEI